MILHFEVPGREFSFDIALEYSCPGESVGKLFVLELTDLGAVVVVVVDLTVFFVAVGVDRENCPVATKDPMATITTTTASAARFNLVRVLVFLEWVRFNLIEDESNNRV